MKQTIIAAIFCLTMSNTAWANGIIPATQAENLAEKMISIPQAFTGTPTLVILAFEREQQEEANRVIALIERAATQNTRLKWFQFSVIDNPPSLVRGLIRSGMRDGVDATRHSNTFAYFVDEATWRTSTQLGDSKQAVLATVNATGEILSTTPLRQIQTTDDISRL